MKDLGKVLVVVTVLFVLGWTTYNSGAIHTTRTVGISDQSLSLTKVEDNMNTITTTHTVYDNVGEIVHQDSNISQRAEISFFNIYAKKIAFVIISVLTSICLVLTFKYINFNSILIKINLIIIFCFCLVSGISLDNEINLTVLDEGTEIVSNVSYADISMQDLEKAYAAENKQYKSETIQVKAYVALLGSEIAVTILFIKRR